MIEQHIKAARSVQYWDCPKCHQPINTHDDDVTNGDLIIYVTCDKTISERQGEYKTCGWIYTVSK